MAHNNSFQKIIFKEKKSHSKRSSFAGRYEKLTHYRHIIEKEVPKKSTFDGPYEKLAFYKRSQEKEVLNNLGNKGNHSLIVNLKLKLTKG